MSRACTAHVKPLRNLSQYSRAERNVNAGMVVGIEPSDYPQNDRGA